MFNRLFFPLILVLVITQWVGRPASAVTITGVTIEDVSSELTTSFNRDADYVLDGSGLTGGQHGTTPDGTMWLNSGNGCCGDPADPTSGGTGAVVTFDLGANYDLTSFHVWNYNEGGGSFRFRGADDVEILVASSDVSPVFSSIANENFAVATGAATYAGEMINLIASNVRLVRFNITSNHGGGDEFIGLSEIQFEGEETLVPEPASILVWCLLGLVFTTIGWRRWGRS